MHSIDELAALVHDRAGDESAAVRLAVANEVGRELADLSDALIGRFVAEARASGLSWTEIGHAFGTSKQAAQQRYGAVAGDLGRLPGRWTPAANDALDRAAGDARELGHDHVGTEHALLALVAPGDGIAAEVLRHAGVTRDRILATSCMRLQKRAETPAQLMVMPRLKQALEHGRRTADRVGARAADTEHLLAGIVAVPDSMAVEILRRLRVGPDAVRGALAERLGVEPQRLGARPRRRRRLLGAAR